MIPDDLRQPLQRRRLSDRLAVLKPSALQTATALSILCAAGLTTWAVTGGDPMAGEPVVTVAIERSDPIVTSSVKKPEEEPDDTGSVDTMPGDEVMPEPSAETLALDLADTDQQQAAIIQPWPKRLSAAPIRAVAEKGPYGTLPRIAKNGKKPWVVYARPVGQRIMASDTPRIAIVLGGMGLNKKLTGQAIKELPGEITLAFAPYGKGLQRQINNARRAGHEVMLQLPMEPFGYPAVDPGPRTLLVSDPADTTLNNLKWHMSRFSGYIGIINYMGARFTSQGDGIGHVLGDIKRRGLVYLDDGTSKRSIVPSLGQVVNAPVQAGDMIIDGEVSYNAISAALAKLEQRAASEGFVIGIGSGLAPTIDALTSWARDLEARSIILVPVSAAYRPRRT